MTSCRTDKARMHAPVSRSLQKKEMFLTEREMLKDELAWGGGVCSPDVPQSAVPSSSDWAAKIGAGVGDIQALHGG